MDPFGRMKRNMTSELIEGASDGSIKKQRPDWSNKVADESDSARDLLGSHEGGFDYTTGNADPRRWTRGYVRGS